jgi:hypothetical protein
MIARYLIGTVVCIWPLLYSKAEASWLCEDVDSYYASTKDLQGKQLEMALTRIIKQEYKVVGYSSSWSALNSLDETEKGSGMVRLIYSDDVAPTQTGCPENKCVWNREHLWPQVCISHTFSSCCGPCFKKRSSSKTIKNSHKQSNFCDEVQTMR